MPVLKGEDKALGKGGALKIQHLSAVKAGDIFRAAISVQAGKLADIGIVVVSIGLGGGAAFGGLLGGLFGGLGGGCGAGGGAVAGLVAVIAGVGIVAVALGGLGGLMAQAAVVGGAGFTVHMLCRAAGYAAGGAGQGLLLRLNLGGNGGSWEHADEHDKA